MAGATVCSGTRTCEKGTQLKESVMGLTDEAVIAVGMRIQQQCEYAVRLAEMKRTEWREGEKRLVTSAQSRPELRTFHVSTNRHDQLLCHSQHLEK
jgi:hypothetical protein